MFENNINSKNKIKCIKNFLWFVIILIVMLIMVILIIFIDSKEHNEPQKEIIIGKIKEAKDYTWEDYELLSPDEKMFFPDQFGSMEEFNNWYENAQKKDEENTSIPKVDFGNRNPESFSWKEYTAMTPEEQMVFPDYFNSMEDFNRWYENAQKEAEEINNINIPEIDTGDKSAESFTWEEYLNLTPEEQMVFPDYFDSMDDFNKWYKEAQNAHENKENTFESSQLYFGDKSPEEYTWEDYKKLTIEEQMLFPDCFESYNDFKAWYNKNNPGE